LQVGKKGYVQMQTNYGALNLEIHCDWAPRTSWNFMTLCRKGYFNDTKFHRLVPGFVLQGGDPTGTGAGGVSAWGKPFRDEFDSRLLHDRRGILSMANSGENTNNSQFFITLQPAPHLDLKHPIFGRLVGGGSVLDAIEAIGSEQKERPNEDIVIMGTQIIVDPIPEADELLTQAVLRAQNQRLGRTTAIPPNPAQQQSATLMRHKQEQHGDPQACGARPLSQQSGGGDSSSRSRKAKAAPPHDTAAMLAFMKSEGALVDERRTAAEPASKKKKLSGFENW
jgi:cyclophilin family peptidyl-prolyl cis-trans isomerase